MIFFKLKKFSVFVDIKIKKWHFHCNILDRDSVDISKSVSMTMIILSTMDVWHVQDVSKSKKCLGEASNCRDGCMIFMI